MNIDRLFLTYTGSEHHQKFPILLSRNIFPILPLLDFNVHNLTANPEDVWRIEKL